MNVAFTLISFAVLKWDECLSVELPFKLPVQIPIQLLPVLVANLLDQNMKARIWTTLQTHPCNENRDGFAVYLIGM